MNNQINIDIPVNTVIEKQPDILPILVELGFKPLTKPTMRNTLGRIISLRKGCDMINLPLADLKQELQWNGYEIIEGEDND